jgi:nucleoside-diphosphate-sugar epimerase
MKIFITGATGYIGFNVALALRRAGHAVWGLARSKDKAHLLAAQEIHAVVGTLQQPDSYLPIAEQCAVLIHAAVDFQADTFVLDRRTVEGLLAAGQRGAQPKTVIYTSGAWVYGDTGGELVDETTPLTPPRLVEMRPATEQMVLTARGVRGLVIRPGCVYGRQGGLTGIWFSGTRGKALKVIGSGNNRWAMVHVDDLADGYLRVAESHFAGEVFNFTDRSRSTVGGIVRAVAQVAGYTDPIQFILVAEAARTLGELAHCLALDQHVDARKAVRLLGWQPRHGSFVDEVETYYQSWKAAQQA